MIFYPKGYFKKVADISIDYLKANHIKGLILDVDNTLIDYYQQMTEDTKQWVQLLKENGFQVYVLSNSNKKEKVEKVAKQLGVKYSNLGMKPFKRGFQKAQTMLNLSHYEIAAVGDQIFTDVIGANRMKMFSILVEPIEEKDIWVTLLKRPIEKFIKKQYFKTR